MQRSVLRPVMAADGMKLLLLPLEGQLWFSFTFTMFLEQKRQGKESDLLSDSLCCF